MQNYIQLLFSMIIGLLFIITQIGCGKKSETGQVNLQFQNQTASNQAMEFQSVGFRGILNGLSLQSSSLLGVTPTIYQMKLVAIYLVENIDAQENNVGSGARIWTSAKCDADLTYCGINSTHSGQYLADYFDFAGGSAAVNAAFKAYTRDTKESQIGEGTYRYLRIDFTGKVYSDSDQTPNLKFGTTVANEVRAQNGSFKMELPEPLVIKKGESFSVDLGYSLDNSFYESGTYARPPSEVSNTRQWTCNGLGSNIPCIVEPIFSPTVTKN